MMIEEKNSNILELDDYNFDQLVLKSEKASLVDFWAPWCGPCRMIASVIREVSDDLDGKAIVGKINVDENPIIAGRYKIMSIPALLIFKGGKIIDQLIGAQPKDIILKRLKSAIGE